MGLGIGLAGLGMGYVWIRCWFFPGVDGVLGSQLYLAFFFSCPSNDQFRVKPM